MEQNDKATIKISSNVATPFAQTYFHGTRADLKVGEVTIWQGHPAEQVKTMKEHLEKLKKQGVNSLNDE